MAHQLRGARIHTENAFCMYILDMEPVLRTIVAWMTLWHPTSPTTLTPGRVDRPLRPLLRGWTALIDPAIVARWNVTESQVKALTSRLQASGPGPNQLYALEPANYMQPLPIED